MGLSSLTRQYKRLVHVRLSRSIVGFKVLFLPYLGCSLVNALECATLHPAQVMGIDRAKGTLDFGSDADFVLLDQDLEVQATYIGGECVWNKDAPSV